MKINVIYVKIIIIPSFNHIVFNYDMYFFFFFFFFF